MQIDLAESAREWAPPGIGECFRQLRAVLVARWTLESTSSRRRFIRSNSRAAHQPNSAGRVVVPLVVAAAGSNGSSSSSCAKASTCSRVFLLCARIASKPSASSFTKFSMSLRSLSLEEDFFELRCLSFDEGFLERRGTEGGGLSSFLERRGADGGGLSDIPLFYLLFMLFYYGFLMVF
ncbi:unnamed protein product [Microthlaspi erraticum]|uniref:Uncharacterized protein n=1 Tax=Microthlaspi erraticum TaxID=1685480 RepID=A0A6D2JI69_9BRAS|nr:unnamed protein product [Microthlaspi erraticum]